jgi:putative phosphoesterase
MRTIGLISDTHGFLDEKVFLHCHNVDEIWHAGDFGTAALADKLSAFKPLRGVYGNIDGQDIRIQFPEYLFFTVENVSVLILHIGGYPPNYNAHAKTLLEKYNPHLFISGHSHILKVMPDVKRNILHMNPGACGNHGWHKIKTMLRFVADDDKIRNLEVIELGKRGIVK